MRGICSLSRRWHEYSRRFVAISGKTKCPQYCPLSRQYRVSTKDRRDRTLTKSRGDGVQVREFEQFGSDLKTRVAIDPNAELKREEKLILSKIKELESEIAVLRQGPFGPNSELMQSLSPDDRSQLLKALEEEGLAIDTEEDLASLKELDEIIEAQDETYRSEELKRVPGVTLRIPQLQKAYVKRFNESLNSFAEGDGHPQQALVLWKWYLRCQQHVLGFSRIVPEDVWQILWRSQTVPLNRPKHIVMLARDMLAAGLPLSGAQWIVYIESLHADGDTPAAVAAWEQQKSSLGNDGDVAEDFWSLGVRLYAILGRPQKAQELAFECLDQGTVIKPQALVPVISAWAQSQNTSAPQKAWTCYLKLRTQAGDQMTPELFEQVSNSFLKGGQADMALAVFKDMVLAQEKSSADSTVVYERALDYVKDLQSHAVTEEHVNRVSLSALLILPKSFQNKYFFGSWIKKLIGQGEIDAAATVVELMYERGVKLDARHLNGIVGAWLRDGSPSSREKAEKMAWAMVHARVAFVRKREQRRTVSSLDDSGPSRSSRRFSVDRIPPFLRRAAPPATIETFSILLLHYTRRSDTPTAEYLTYVMTGPAQITPNAFIMNHWLYAALRSSDLQAVWDKYVSLKCDIQPDLETFAALWDTGKIQYDKSRVAHAKRFPSARQLFGEMSSWVRKLPERNSKRAKEEFSRELHDQIIRCFCLSSDLPGTLCALHGLKNLFGEYPDESTTRMIVIQVSRLLPSEPSRKSSGRGLSRRKLSQLKDAMSSVSLIIETIANQHAVDLLENGINPDTLDPNSDLGKKLQLDILTDFLLAVMERMKKADGNVENEVKTVARVMEADISEVVFASTKLSGGDNTKE